METTVVLNNVPETSNCNTTFFVGIKQVLYMNIRLYLEYLLPYRVDSIIQTPDIPEQYFSVSYPFRYKHMTYDTKHMSKNNIVISVICIVTSMILSIWTLNLKNN